MHAGPECIPCTFRQALAAMRQVTQDTKLQRDAMVKLSEWFSHADLDNNPSMVSQPAYTILSDLTGIADPYLERKNEGNRAALAVRDRVRNVITDAVDPLDMALHVAAAGNTIDHGIGHSFNIEKDIIKKARTGFAVNDIMDFRKELAPGRKLLYLGDNAGEIVFDALLIEQILKTGTEVIFSVKSGPIINDATMDDAKETGMTDLVKVIETGGADIGINWNNISDEFRQEAETSDVIIAKGHGNYETCEDHPGNFYFLIQAKCDFVARTLGINLFDIAFRKSSNRQIT